MYFHQFSIKCSQFNRKCMKVVGISSKSQCFQLPKLPRCCRCKSGLRMVFCNLVIREIKLIRIELNDFHAQRFLAWLQVYSFLHSCITAPNKRMRSPG